MIASLSDAALLLSGSIELALLAKATLILLAALLITQLASRSRASVRHVVIASAFAALVALPILIAAAPRWSSSWPHRPCRPREHSRTPNQRRHRNSQARARKATSL